jgi:hypothetical protein
MGTSPPHYLDESSIEVKNILQTLSIWSDSASRNINLQQIKAPI